MSFGFSIGDFITLLELANKVRRRFIDAPDQFRAVCDEVKGLSSVLRDLEDVLPERSLTDKQTASLGDILEACKRILTDLNKCLDRYQELGDQDKNGHTGFGTKSRRFWKRLRFEPDDIRDLRSRLQSHIGILAAFMERIDITLSYAIKAGVDRLNTHRHDQHFLAIMNWLSDTNFSAQQSDIFSRCQEGTGQWLLESNEYKAWIDGSEPLLFCPGIPGAGKTCLTSIVINNLQETFGQDPDVGLAYLFLNYKRQAEQTTDKLLGSLLKHFLQERPSSITETEDLYEKHAQKGSRPSSSELRDALLRVSRQLPRAFILIDALDECTTSSVRSKFLKEVSALQLHAKISIFVTSRHLPEIKSLFEGSPSVEICAADGDVRRYLENHMAQLPKCIQRSDELQQTIVTEITEAVDGMFLLAQLHLGSLSGKTTTKAVKTALRSMPKGSDVLHLAYVEALGRIEAQQPDMQHLAKQVMYWITCAARQLSASELQEALAVEEGTSELDGENKPDLDDIVSVCLGLVTIDEDSNIIRLVHYTTQEFLENLPDWILSALLKEGYDPQLTDSYGMTPLMYAAFRGNEAVTDILLNIPGIDVNLMDVLGNTALHHAARRQNESIVRLLLQQGIEVNLRTSYEELSYDETAEHNCTAFMLAVMNLDEGMVRLMLEKGGLDMACRNGNGRTALMLAYQRGLEAIVNLLEAAGAEGEIPDIGLRDYSYESIMDRWLDA
ncbi:MAG: hypothetical protein Q9218_007413 [Villophora microphyllina]